MVLKRFGRKPTFLISIIMIFLILVAVYGISALNINKSEAKIVRLALEKALIEEELPDLNLHINRENLVLSKENVSSKLIPRLPGFKLTLLEQKQIQEKANKEGDFLYLRFQELNVTPFRATVSLENVWAVGKGSKQGYLSGGGFTATYYNILGIWVKSPVNKIWIS